MTKLQVKTFTEKRPPDIQAVVWRGVWEHAYEYVKLWPEATGFEVRDEFLVINFATGSGKPQLILQRGALIEVEESHWLNPGTLIAKRILSGDDLASYQLKDDQ